MVKTVEYDKGKSTITTACGVIGHGDGLRGPGHVVKVTGFSSMTTCPECRKTPGVTGIRNEQPMPGQVWYTGIDHTDPNHTCPCRTFFPEVDLGEVKKF